MAGPGVRIVRSLLLLAAVAGLAWLTFVVPDVLGLSGETRTVAFLVVSMAIMGGLFAFAAWALLRRMD